MPGNPDKICIHLPSSACIPGTDKLSCTGSEPQWLLCVSQEAREGYQEDGAHCSDQRDPPAIEIHLWQPTHHVSIAPKWPDNWKIPGTPVDAAGWCQCEKKETVQSYDTE